MVLVWDCGGTLRVVMEGGHGGVLDETLVRLWGGLMVLVETVVGL